MLLWSVKRRTNRNRRKLRDDRMTEKDADIIRELAGRVSEIAALPVQDEKRALWRKLNAKQPERPMVMID